MWVINHQSAFSSFFFSAENEASISQKQKNIDFG